MKLRETASLKSSRKSSLTKQSREKNSQKNMKSLKFLKNMDDITSAYKNILLKSLMNNLERELYDETLKDLKKIFSSDNYSTGNFILLDFFVGLIQINKNLESVYQTQNTLLKKIEEIKTPKFLSIQFDSSIKQIINKVIIKRLEEVIPLIKEFKMILQPFYQIDNFETSFLKSKHSIFMTFLVLSIVFQFNLNITKQNEENNFTEYTSKLIKENNCIKLKENKSCVICDIANKLLNTILNQSQTPPYKNKSKIPNLFINSNLYKEGDKNGSTSNNSSKYSFLINKSEDGLRITPTAKNNLITNDTKKSRNLITKINNPDFNRDTLNSVDITKKPGNNQGHSRNPSLNLLSSTNPVKIPILKQNDFSNYQKYIKNTKFIKIKESPIARGKPQSIDNNSCKQSYTAISSNNTKSKSNHSRDIFSTDKDSCLTKPKTKNIRSKVFENVFYLYSDKEETNAVTSSNTNKHEQLTNLTVDYYSGNSNKSNAFKSSFRESNSNKKSDNKFISSSINKTTNSVEKLKYSDVICSDQKFKRKLNLGLLNANYVNCNLNSDIQIRDNLKENKKKITKSATENYFIKIDESDNNSLLLSEDILKLNSTKNQNSKRIGNFELEEKEINQPDEQTIMEKIQVIEGEIKIMELSIKSFGESNNKIKQYLCMHN